MAAATAVIGVVAAVQITVRGGWPTALLTVVFSVLAAVWVVAMLTVGGFALVFTAEFVQRQRRARRQRAYDRAFHLQVAPYWPLSAEDIERLARALGMTDWERP
jgi:hypothetical protein